MNVFKCSKCGMLVEPIACEEADLSAMNSNLEKLVPGTTDGAHEKHVPVYTVSNNLVSVDVGSVAHPMMEAHYIEWIAIETNQGTQRKLLKPNTAPKAVFALAPNEEVLAVYAYCNLHGLWKA